MKCYCKPSICSHASLYVLFNRRWQRRVLWKTKKQNKGHGVASEWLIFICCSCNKHPFSTSRVSSSSTGHASASSKGTFDSWWTIWKHCSQQSFLLSLVSSTVCLTRSVSVLVFVVVGYRSTFLCCAEQLWFSYFPLQVFSQANTPMKRWMLDFAFRRKESELKNGVVRKDSLWDKLIFKKVQVKQTYFFIYICYFTVVKLTNLFNHKK